MDITAKKKVLGRLAATGEPKALASLQNEVKKIAEIISNESNYTVIRTQIDLLESFAYRVYEDAFAIIGGLLLRSEKIQLTYDPLPGKSEADLEKFYNKDVIIIKALELLKGIRYHLPDKILQLFLEYTSDQYEENIRKEAFSCLKAFAEYNLDIFYSNNDGWRGLGSGPQHKACEFIGKLSVEEQKKYFSGIIVLCEEILSPTLSGTSSTYKKMMLRTGVIPASEDIKEIRSKSILILSKLYALAYDVNDKKKIMHALQAATRTPSMTTYSDDFYEMIINDTIQVLDSYYNFLVDEKDLQVIQDIEHLTYWNHKHTRKQDINVRRATLKIKEIIDRNAEYQIFKILIGFDGVFAEWRDPITSSTEEEKIWEDEYRNTNKIRNEKSNEFAERIDDDNFEEWKARVLNYVKIQSNDLATFPFFIKFLERFGKASPIIAFKLLRDHADDLEGFLTFILLGIWETSEQDKARQLMLEWANTGKYLASIARLFEYEKKLDLEILILVVKKSKENKNTPRSIIALRHVIAAIVTNYDKSRIALLGSIFLDAIQQLTALGDSLAVMHIWFLKELDQIVTDMSDLVIDAVLENLLPINRIDHHAERVLTAIANRAPEKVIEFFGKRLGFENRRSNFSYDAVPFNFYTLQVPLSKIPEAAIDIVSQWYDESYGLFIYRGANLLKNIFPDFPPRFEAKLLEFVKSNNQNNLMIVMAILRNYQGSPLIHQVCKEIVKKLPVGSDELGEIRVILRESGVVSGEFGLAEAYERKKQEVETWLSDSNENIRLFASNYMNQLDHAIEYEKKRVNEDIELMKFKYGDDESDN